MSDIALARQILSKALFVPEDRLHADTEIATIKEMDSLSFEALVLEIEDRLDRSVDPLVLIDVRTVADLEDVLGKLR